MQLIATLVFVAGILGLFYLDRDANVRTSIALWIPTIWLLIIGSRPVSSWSQQNTVDSAITRAGEGSPLDAALYGALIFAGVLFLNFRARQVKSYLRINAPILVFFTLCAISILWSEYPMLALKRWIKGAGDLVMVLVVLTDPNPLAAIKRLFKRTAFVLLPLSVLFILFFPNLGTAFDRSSQITYYSGVATQKNELGQTCMICGLAMLWSFLLALENRATPHRARHLCASGLLVALAIGLIVRADSMTSLSCFSLSATVMIFCTRRWVSAHTRGVHFLVAGAVAIPLFAVFIDSAGTLLQSVGRSTTLTGRTAVWKAVLSLHTNPLIGTGYESFWLGNRILRVWAMTQKGLHEALNGYLEVYLNLGYLGLIFLGWMLIAGYSQIMGDFRRHPEAAKLRLAFFTAAMIYNLTEAGFQLLNFAWVALLLAITAIPLRFQQLKPLEVFGSIPLQTPPSAEPKPAFGRSFEIL
jgi:O-antigen ligase